MDQLTKMMSTHSVTLISPQGVRQEGVKCQLHAPEVLIPSATVDVAEGFLLEHLLPNGRTERYEVVGVHFTPAMMGAIPAHYRLEIRKASAPERHGPQAIVYNVSGQNARVNVNSTDASLNVAQVEQSVLFAKMRAAAGAMQENARRSEVLAAIDSLESESGGVGYAAAYQRFIAVVADHIAVFGPFLPALAQLFIR